MGSDVGFWGYWHNQSLSVRLSGTIMALHLELERGAYLDARDCEQSEGDKVNRDEHSSIVGWRKAWFSSNCPKFFYLFALIPNQSQELSLLKHASILMYKWHYFFWSNLPLLRAGLLLIPFQQCVILKKLILSLFGNFSDCSRSVLS